MSVWSARLVVGCAFFSFALPGIAETEVLHAWKAELTGNLKLQDEKEAATIRNLNL